MTIGSVFSFQNHKLSLSSDELTTVRRNLQTQGVEVDNEFVSIDTALFAVLSCLHRPEVYGSLRVFLAPEDNDVQQRRWLYTDLNN